jgi:hypothetical protein
MLPYDDERIVNAHKQHLMMRQIALPELYSTSGCMNRCLTEVQLCGFISILYAFRVSTYTSTYDKLLQLVHFIVREVRTAGIASDFL